MAASLAAFLPGDNDSDAAIPPLVSRLDGLLRESDAVRRAAEERRRAEIAAWRAGRVEKPFTASGPSHRPRRARQLNHPIRDLAEKQQGIEEARQHEAVLAEAEADRVAEQERRHELVRKGDLIVRGC